jgi:hypothetical protein
VPLAGWSEKRRRAVVPLDRWPERQRRKFERAFGLRKPTVRQREVLRNVVALYVALYEKALILPDESTEELRGAMTELREMAGKAAAHGLRLGFSDTQQTITMRALVWFFLGDVLAVVGVDDLRRQSLEPELLALLVKRMAPGAWSFRTGPRIDWALMEFVARLDRLAEALCGVPLTFSVYQNESGSDDSAWYGGTLLEVVQLLQPALPRVAGSIAEESERELGARLHGARDAYHRAREASIP